MIYLFFLFQSLIPCSSDEEEKLLLDVTKIIEISNMIDKTKENMRNVVADVLSSIGYDSSVCICKWDKTSSHPAGNLSFFFFFFYYILLINFLSLC